MLLLTIVLPMATSPRQSGRCVTRYAIAAARKWFGLSNPTLPATMPWRS